MIDREGIAIIDGAVKGNPGKGGIGVVLKDRNGERIFFVSKEVGDVTNNEAEWLSFIEALNLARRNKFLKLEVITDSQLLARQWSGLYKTRAKNLLKLYKKAKKLAEGFKELILRQGTRKEIREAHILAHQALKKVIEYEDK
ncbi:reverse transcriptase-like protein [bacterium]|nr:reverse transcriptase-like protein [bacterium]